MKHEPLDVVAGILGNDRGEVLIARRPAHKHHGGLWEFPGGKREPGESPHDALVRELHEELGIEVRSSARCCNVREARPDRPLLLRTLRVLAFEGTPSPLEHDELAWCAPQLLATHDLAPADRRIASVLTMPKRLAVTPGPERFNEAEWMKRIDTAIAIGFDRLHLRRGHSTWADHLPLARRIVARVREAGITIAVHDDPDLAHTLSADALHVSGARLPQWPIDQLRAAAPLIGVSTHRDDEPSRINELAPDYLLLGNVRETPSHPGRAGIGWNGFEEYALRCDAPMYAIGGVAPSDHVEAEQHGAIGIASISAWFADR